MPLAVVRSALRGLLLSSSRRGGGGGGRGGGGGSHRAVRNAAAGAVNAAAINPYRIRAARSLIHRPAPLSSKKRLTDVVAVRTKVAAVRTISAAPSREAPYESSRQSSEADSSRGVEEAPSACDLSEEEDVQLRAVVTMQPGATVVCTQEEEEIFSTLLAVVKHHELPVTLRVAGGWVRDKLLGKHSSDIDIALDTMLGREFADLVNEYLRLKGEETHGVGVIQSNPDQSKHLETATMRVRDVWLDLVNLRSENYSDESRIPEMTFGSATDDAYRRDLTINSLFYNINLRCVEDFTGMGMEDLQKGVVRTPLPPRTTFMDDPLRILRAVRFAARFGFSLDPSIVRAATDPEVQTALRTKVSRERVGKEVSSMLRGPSPGDALTLLCRFKLFDIVFAHGVTHPETLEQMSSDTTAWACLHSARSLDALLSAHANAGGEPFGRAFSCEEREWLVLAAFLAPLQALATPGKKNKLTPVVETVVKQALKLRVKDADAVNLALGLSREMRTQLLGMLPHDGDDDDDGGGGVAGAGAGAGARAAGDVSFSRLDAGRLLRRGKEHWRLALWLGAVLEMPGIAVLGDGAEVEPWAVESAQGLPAAETLAGGHGSPLHAFSVSSLAPDSLDGAGAGAGAVGGGGSGSGGSGGSSAARVRASAAMMAARVRTAEETVAGLRLDHVWELKPLLDGQAVMKAVGMTKGGPALGQLNARLVDWQLEHPEGTEAEAVAHLRVIAPGILNAK